MKQIYNIIEEVYNNCFAKHYGNINKYFLFSELEGVNELGDVLLFGDADCFDVDEFYQYAITTNGKVYRCYYHFIDCEGNSIELDSIDYSKPYRVEEVTDEFIIE